MDNDIRNEIDKLITAASENEELCKKIAAVEEENKALKARIRELEAQVKPTSKPTPTTTSTRRCIITDNGKTLKLDVSNEEERKIAQKYIDEFNNLSKHYLNEFKKIEDFFQGML